MGRKTHKNRIVIDTEALDAEGWKVSGTYKARTAIMTSQIHGNKSRRQERRAQRSRDRFDARDLRIERDYI